MEIKMSFLVNFRIFLIVFIAFCVRLGAYSSEIMNECDYGYISSCGALKFEADSNKDSKNAKVFESKILNLLDSACKRDYNSCLILANMYDNNDKKENELLLNLLDSMHSKHLANLINTKITNDNSKAIAYKERAVPLLESSCFNDSNVSACLILSYYNDNGIAMAKNTPKAARLLSMSLEYATQNCMLGLQDSCFLLDKYPNYLKDIESKVHIFKQDCQKGDSIACFKVAYFYTQDFYTSAQSIENLSREEKQKRYDIWDKIDFVKSGEYLQKACKNAPKICENTIYELPYAKSCLKDSNMQSCSKVKSQKAEFLSLACESGDLNSCYNLKDLPIFSQQKRKIKYLQKLCKGGIIQSCNDLYDIYATSDKDKAASYAKRSCSWAIKNKLDSANACEIAGDSYLQSTKPEIIKAKESYKYSCENMKNKDSKACEKLGAIYEKYDKDSTLAKKYYEQSCEKENSDKACLALANALSSNIESKENINKAISIYNKILLDSNDKSPLKKEIYINLVNLYSNDDIYEKESLDYTSIIRQIASACESGIANACALVANFSSKKIAGAIINKDIAIACRMGDYNECYELANVLSLDSKYAKNIRLNNNDISTLLRVDSKDSKASFTAGSLNYKKAAKSLYKYACENGQKDACRVVFYDNYVDSALLQKNVCLLLRADSLGSSREKIDNICKIYAQNAFNAKEYDNVLLALNGFKNSNDIDALNWLLAANFALQHYDSILKIYKIMYKKNLPNDYFFLAKMYESGAKSPVQQESAPLVQNYEKAFRIYSLTDSTRNLNAIGEMHELGLGFYKDSGKAREFYKKACPLKGANNASFNACVKLYEYEKSQDNIERARHYLQKACLVPLDAISALESVNKNEICEMTKK